MSAFLGPLHHFVLRFFHLFLTTQPTFHRILADNFPVNCEKKQLIVNEMLGDTLEVYIERVRGKAHEVRLETGTSCMVGSHG